MAMYSLGLFLLHLAKTNPAAASINRTASRIIVRYSGNTTICLSLAAGHIDP
jgi:hypothetical protein